METLIYAFNEALNFWLNTTWYIALLISTVVNILIFVVTAATLDYLTKYLSEKRKVGGYIDTKPLKENQRIYELKFGITACFIFAIGSLFTRVLYTDIWPSSLFTLALQAVVFSLYYETYSYFVHRLLHKGFLRKVHSVHHRSVRVTPWSGYSVHPIEALLISISAPLFMFFFPLSLGVALIFHIIGMVFTITIHSNFRFNAGGYFFKTLSHYMEYHHTHHSVGYVNFGFINKFWDSMLNTRFKGS